MKEFDILRLEINYFLCIVDSTLSVTDSNLAKDALSSLIISFLFGNLHNFYEYHIQVIEEYISFISNLPEEEYCYIKTNVPHVINLLNLIKQEIIK
ncbi:MULTISPECIES: hypothetical protein [Clostridium]|uniref:Uncharacterized protein n=2 Tax=Clostridium TaxID=1485 RepID=A0AAC9RRY6_9CLOT|nr:MULTISPECIES: hypothetical protein [Clostridium]AOY75368.1 hypothetical protein BJL90_05315 [Clostridium formicaceticum]ARE89823.1 hypothetical protein CLFO_43060 [Clostridium formicaceticum]MBD8045748.1 hypothetical protein [Clostridium faecium]